MNAKFKRTNKVIVMIENVPYFTVIKASQYFEDYKEYIYRVKIFDMLVHEYDITIYEGQKEFRGQRIRNILR